MSVVRPAMPVTVTAIARSRSVLRSSTLCSCSRQPAGVRVGQPLGLIKRAHPEPDTLVLMIQYHTSNRERRCRDHALCWQALAAENVLTVGAALPLSGLRVVEISSFVAAPLCGMTLAQLGAEVIRIDPPGGAADIHRWPLTVDGESLYWNGLNKGKRSACIDVRSAEGQELVSRLIVDSGPDGGIVLTNSVGLGQLAYEQLHRRRRDLILLQIQGYQDGRSAVDYTVNAGMGFPMITGPESHTGPVNHVLPAWDIACGLYAAIAILAADRQRRVQGVGAELFIALNDVALATAGNLGLLAEAQVNGVDRKPIGNHLYGGFARDFTCADGARVMVCALTKRHWRDLVDITRMRGPVHALEESLGVDFDVEDRRFEFREVLAALFTPWFTANTFPAVAAVLQGSSLLWSKYQTFTDLLDGQLDDNMIVSNVHQPGIGDLLTPGSPIRMNGTPIEALPAPPLGADTANVIASMEQGSANYFDELAARGVVPSSKPA